MTPHDAFWAIAAQGDLPIAMPITIQGEHGLIAAKLKAHDHVAMLLRSQDESVRLRTMIGAMVETRDTIQRTYPNIHVA